MLTIVNSSSNATRATKKVAISWKAIKIQPKSGKGGFQQGLQKDNGKEIKKRQPMTQ